MRFDKNTRYKIQNKRTSHPFWLKKNIYIYEHHRTVLPSHPFWSKLQKCIKIRALLCSAPWALLLTTVQGDNEFSFIRHHKEGRGRIFFFFLVHITTADNSYFTSVVAPATPCIHKRVFVFGVLFLGWHTTDRDFTVVAPIAAQVKPSHRRRGSGEGVGFAFPRPNVLSLRTLATGIQGAGGGGD